MIKKLNLHLIILGSILILGFILRVYKLDAPVADWHSWRQADTAAVARNFYKEGYNPFIPKYDDMSGVAENPKPNPERYRFVEFPIYNSLVYFSYLLNGGVDEKLARLVSIFMSLGSATFIYLIVRKYWGEFDALLSALIFVILPFNIFFSRVILPEPSLVFYSLGMFYFTSKWIWENNLKLFLLSIFFTALAFLTKPSAVFYLFPLIFVYWQKEKRLWPIPPRYLLWGILSLTPFALWRYWMSNFPEGIPASNWLFNGNGIRFRPAFWRWIVGDRFGREILSAPGFFLFLLGILKRPALHEGYVLHLLMLSLFGFLIVFATGNVQHDYYQTLIIPGVAIFTARGLSVLLKGSKEFLPRIFSIPLALLIVGLALYLTWNEVKGLYQINNGVIVEAGLAADKILPKDAKVVAPYGGDTAFLYQVNRPGFAFVVLPIEELKSNFGINYYVSVNFDDQTNEVIKTYKVIHRTPKFVIVDLTQRNSN
ncbi:MAG: glycosyltransferase family 39 protein [Candidatus Daviesbacteria bacterium]|nr:glycosyltransferase family 39 protein [Candidatus Daviesbacteria bacterium]